MKQKPVLHAMLPQVSINSTSHKKSLTQALRAGGHHRQSQFPLIRLLIRKASYKEFSDTDWNTCFH